MCLRDLKEKCASEYLRLCCTICCLISTLWYASFPRRFLNAVLLLDILWWLPCWGGGKAKPLENKHCSSLWGEEEESKQRQCWQCDRRDQAASSLSEALAAPSARMKMLPGPSSCVYTTQLPSVRTTSNTLCAPAEWGSLPKCDSHGNEDLFDAIMASPQRF